jgi:hypothetical protein
MELELEALKAYADSLEAVIYHLGNKYINNYGQGNAQLKDLITDMQKYTHSSVKLTQIKKQIAILENKPINEINIVTNQGCHHD